MNDALKSDEIFELEAEVEFEVNVKALERYKLLEYRIDGKRLVPGNLVIGWWKFEVAKTLCLQPVRIGGFVWADRFPPTFSFSYTGSGLGFGMPGAHTQWGKAAVNFQVRGWKTIYNTNFETFSQSEDTALLATVDDDDCVEVFFVDRFSPNDLYGGGATWSGGLVSTKIISSDENVVHGVDLTHLAHELGHAMTLKHPGSGFPTASSPHRIDGSTGTLLCGSGFMSDNPAVNSQWNRDSVQNPLFTYSLRFVGPGPDCEDDADCGAC